VSNILETSIEPADFDSTHKSQHSREKDTSERLGEPLRSDSDHLLLLSVEHPKKHDVAHTDETVSLGLQSKIMISKPISKFISR
jgi:hypothetical protein